MTHSNQVKSPAKHQEIHPQRFLLSGLLSFWAVGSIHGLLVFMEILSIQMGFMTLLGGYISAFTFLIVGIVHNNKAVLTKQSGAVSDEVLKTSETAS